MSNQQELLCADFPALHLVRTGRRVRLLGRLTLYALIATIILMVFVPWRQTARGTGTVVATDPQQRPQPVLCPAEGVIEWTREDLREGSYVERGDLVARIAPFAEDTIAQLQQQIDTVELKKEAAKLALESAILAQQGQKDAGVRFNEALNDELEAARSKLEQVKNDVPQMQADLNDKINKYNNALKVTPLTVSREELFSMRQEVDAAKVKLQKANNAVIQAEADFKSKQADVQGKRLEIEIKNNKAAIAVQEKQDKLNSILNEMTEYQNKKDGYRLDITAPRSGFIQQWTSVVGSDIVKKGDALCIIVPETTDLAVEMQVTGNDMPLIHEGDRVRLQFEGWPAVQFVGWPSVAVGTFGGKVNRVFPTDDSKGNFRVLVTPDKHFDGESDWPDSRYLRQGVRANGWVLLRQVPLGYEIWRQLNGFPPVVSDEEPGKGKGKDDKGSKVKLPKA